MRASNERGMAMITTLLVLMLITALLVGFTTVIISDQRYRIIDRDRGQAFYAASGAMEKLTADLGNTFFKFVAPTDAQISALTTMQPSISGVTFTAVNAPTALPASETSPLHCFSTTTPTYPTTVNRAFRTDGTAGYTISFCEDTATHNPTTTPDPTLIKTGPYADLWALKTPYQLDVTAKTAAGGEAHLVRTIEAVAIPVFQFGIFSDVDLAFNAADDFSFGGRVHTNGNLFLAQGGSSTLTISDKVTAVKEVVRTRLSNGVAITTSGHTGTVNIATSTSAVRALGTGEGSVVDGPTSASNDPPWTNISLTTYNKYIRNYKTGAKALNLPLITVGGTSPDLTKRPTAGEDVSNPILYNERLYTRASIRILLSDKASEITNLPGVTATAPVSLGGNWNVAAQAPGGYTVNGANGRPPIALSPGLQEATLSANVVSGSATINVSAVPAYFQTAGGAQMVADPTGANVPVTCVGRDVTNFLSCTVAVGDRNKTVLSGRVIKWTLADGRVVQTTLNGGWGTGNGAATNIAINGNTAGFAPNVFWLKDTLISCTGLTGAGTQFTGCAGVPAANNGDKVTTSNHTPVDTPMIGGYLKIERQGTDGTWTDITAEMLGYGIGAPNIDVATGTACADPSPNGIVRIQRLKDNAGGTTTTAGGGCGYAADATGYRDPTSWWPMVLYDTREGVFRDDNYPADNPPNVLPFNGLFHYVMLDVRNLAKWFKGAAPYASGTGTNSKTDNGGFTVYFSDRRNNKNETNQETGEYGFEDIVNPGSTNGAPNGSLDAGENVNASIVNNVPTQDLYGGEPSYTDQAGVGGYNTLPPNAVGIPTTSPYKTGASTTPATAISQSLARVNRQIFFRRALKLVNGNDIYQQNVTGLSIVAENPIYVQGDWNANPGGTGGFTYGTGGTAHAATSIIGDAVTILSNNWNDINSLKSPYTPSSRPRPTQSWYRMAIIGGKNMIFPNISGTSSTFGTDGGAHAFIRYLEGQPGGGGDTINYKGSLATFYYSRQATSIFKGSGNYVYEIPSNRAFSFDIDFKTPSLLPPNTPVFRDMNAVGFSQELRPGK